MKAYFSKHDFAADSVNLYDVVRLINSSVDLYNFKVTPCHQITHLPSMISKVKHIARKFLFVRYISDKSGTEDPSSNLLSLECLIVENVINSNSIAPSNVSGIWISLCVSWPELAPLWSPPSSLFSSYIISLSALEKGTRFKEDLRLEGRFCDISAVLKMFPSSRNCELLINAIVDSASLIRKA